MADYEEDDECLTDDDSQLVDTADEEMIIVGVCRKRKCRGTLLTPLHVTALDPDPIPFCGKCGESAKKLKHF